jgi:hypothetical protein
MAKEKIIPPLPHPPAFIVDVYINHLFAGGEEDKQTAYRIISYVLEYHKACSEADSRMMTKIQNELMSKLK